MNLTQYQQIILTAELAKSDYNGMTSSQAWDWLTIPVYQSTVSVNSGVLLTPSIISSAIGPTKANAIASAFATTYPAIASMILNDGIDPTDATEIQPFLQTLVVSGAITQADFNKLVALGTTTLNVGSLQSRFDQRFKPSNWSAHIDLDGNFDVIGNDYCQICNTKNDGLPNPIPSGTVCVNCKSLIAPPYGPPSLPPFGRALGMAFGLHGFINLGQLLEADFNVCWTNAGRS